MTIYLALSLWGMKVLPLYAVFLPVAPAAPSMPACPILPPMCVSPGVSLCTAYMQSKQTTAWSAYVRHLVLGKVWIMTGDESWLAGHEPHSPHADPEVALFCARLRQVFYLLSHAPCPAGECFISIVFPRVPKQHVLLALRGS